MASYSVQCRSNMNRYSNSAVMRPCIATGTCTHARTQRHRHIHTHARAHTQTHTHTHNTTQNNTNTYTHHKSSIVTRFIITNHTRTHTHTHTHTQRSIYRFVQSFVVRYFLAIWTESREISCVWMGGCVSEYLGVNVRRGWTGVSTSFKCSRKFKKRKWNMSKRGVRKN